MHTDTATSIQLPANSVAIVYRGKGPLIQHAGLLYDGNKVFHIHPDTGVRCEDGISEYARGHDVTVRYFHNVDMGLIKQRMNEVLNSDMCHYDAVSNNCEHIMNYILTGDKHSDQLQAIVVGVAAVGLGALMSRALRKNGLTWLGVAFLGGISALFVTNKTREHDTILAA